jgi:hypothetical protein
VGSLHFFRLKTLVSFRDFFCTVQIFRQDCRHSNEKCFMLFSGRDTLLPIIQDWIEPGTLIVSDFWKAYDCLSSSGYQHLKVNHSIEFKDSETGAHTNAIESSWRAAKASMSSSGRTKAHIPGIVIKSRLKSLSEVIQSRCFGAA